MGKPQDGGTGWLVTMPVCPGAKFVAMVPCVVQSKATAEATQRLLRHSYLPPHPSPRIQVRTRVGTQLRLLHPTSRQSQSLFAALSETLTESARLSVPTWPP